MTIYIRQSAARGELSMERPSKAQLAVAYHEAGQAVVARSFQQRVRRVSLQAPGERSEAEAHTSMELHLARLAQEDLLTPSGRASLEQLVIVAYAGEIAESRWKGRHGFQSTRRNWQVASNLRHLSHNPMQVDVYAAWLRVRAADTVERLWAEIERVAHALLSRRALTGAELDQLIEASGPQAGAVE
jgi:hypothetical protein